jgi:alkylation response protein AidB-like acyl-CoA dehydrogenase
VIVIEEVARACAASSLIPAVNKLGTVPLLLAGSEELKQRYLPPIARGEALVSYALSEAGAGSDAGFGGTAPRPLAKPAPWLVMIAAGALLIAAGLARMRRPA